MSERTGTRESGSASWCVSQCEGMVALFEDPPVAMFKIGAANYMADLVENGHVYMNTAGYFTALEEHDPRTDPHEGAAYSRPGKGAILSQQVNGVFAPLGTLTGPVVLTSDELKNANIYCLHVRRRSSHGEAFKLSSLGFDDTAVIILDPVEFLRRVTEAAHRDGHRISYQLVDYVDPDVYRGPMGPFRKFSKYAVQSEHRIAISPGAGGPLSLRIGPINDITLTVPAHNFLKLSAKEDRV